MDDTQRTATDAATGENGPDVDSPSPRPLLRRRTDDSVIAGVASGLAAYLNVDPALVRIGFVVLLFAGGVGLPAYIAGWLLIPEADEHETAAQELVRSKGPGFWIGIGILVLIALAVTDSLSFGRGWWPVVLIGAGIALWRAGQQADGARGPTPPTQYPPTTGVPTHQETTMATVTTPATQEPSRDPVRFTPPPVPERRPNPLARATVAMALIAAGVTVLLDRAGTVEAHLGHVVAASLVVLGLGLVLGAWFGRARSLIGPGLVLVPVVIFAGLFQATVIPWDAGFGEREVNAANAADLDPEYRLAAGKMQLLLDRLPQDAGQVEIRAEVGAGAIEVRVPSDAEVRVRGRANVGQLVLFDRVVKGVGELDETVVRGGEPGAPTIVLDLRVGVGEIVVRTGATSIPSADS